MRPNIRIHRGEKKVTLAARLKSQTSVHAFEGVLVADPQRPECVGMIVQVDNGMFTVVDLVSGNRNTNPKPPDDFCRYLRDCGYDFFHGAFILEAP